MLVDMLCCFSDSMADWTLVRDGTTIAQESLYVPFTFVLKTGPGFELLGQKFLILNPEKTNIPL